MSNMEESNFSVPSTFDLNEELIRNKPCTFFFRMHGDAMIDDGIFSGDALIVDRSILQVDGKVCVVVLEGEMLVRRVYKNFGGTKIVSANKKFETIAIDRFNEFSVWGVVTSSIRSHL